MGQTSFCKFCGFLQLFFVAYHSPRNFYKLIPLPVFCCNYFCNFYGNSLRHRFVFCNSHALLGESRGYCTKTKQEWPDSGSTLENSFCNFYEINSSQDFFCIAKHLVLMVNPHRPNPAISRKIRSVHISEDLRNCKKFASVRLS